MKKSFLLFLIILYAPLTKSFAQHVNDNTLENVALRFIESRAMHGQVPNDHLFGIKDVFTRYNDDEAVYSIVSLTPVGFIIISRDERVVPVLAFSFLHDLDVENPSPALISWLNGYAKQIIELEERQDEDIGRNDQWSYYLDMEYVRSGSLNRIEGVEPLIRSMWEQGYYYNFSCPEDPDGPGGHCYAGCVAIAMSQILFYYRYPDQGTGSIQYVYSFGDTLSVDFSNSTYDWNAMVNYIVGQPNPEVADLIFNAGASIMTAYSPFGSGAYPFFCDEALVEFFRYDSTKILELFRSDTNLSFKDSLMNNLDMRRPILYSGGSWPIKHSFVCDGYLDSSYFHFSFGWNNGQGNGYYHIDDITPFSYDFTHNQFGIFNIFPAEDYPPYAPDYDTLRAQRGTFEDGSGPLDYLSGTIAYWLIEADTGEHIMLYFDSFDLGYGDTVTVYDGAHTNTDELGVFSGGELPPVLASTSNYMLILFNCNLSDEGDGWFANYISIEEPFCQEWKDRTDTVGGIWDGSSNVYDYANNSDCFWHIHPQGNQCDSVAGITLEILEFDTEEYGDFVTVFEGPTTNHPLLEVLSGTDVPGYIYSQSNELLVNFKSNGSITRPGFFIRYCAEMPVYCHDTNMMTAVSGVISDGSGEKLYINNSDCYWLIDPEGGGDTISLNFTEFNLEYGYDWVEILDPETNPPEVIAHFTGDQLPTGTLKTYHGAMLIHFYSDISIIKSGWSAQYSSGPNYINDREIIEYMNCWPVPATDAVHADIHCLESFDVTMELVGINGLTLLRESHHLRRGENAIILNVANLPPGVYLLKILNEQDIKIHKVIIQ